MTIVIIILYFIPTIIAIDRKHKNKLGLFILNFVFGITIIGWIAALIWALNKDSSMKNAA